jgi:hypothetical protein
LDRPGRLSPHEGISERLDKVTESLSGWRHLWFSFDQVHGGGPGKTHTSKNILVSRRLFLLEKLDLFFKLDHLELASDG